MIGRPIRQLAIAAVMIVHTLGSGVPAQAQSPAVATAAGKTIAIKNFLYAPASLTVRVGTRVTVTNRDPAMHTITSVRAPRPFDSTLARGASTALTFRVPGRYNYYCKPHPWMKGAVVVVR